SVLLLVSSSLFRSSAVFSFFRPPPPPTTSTLSLHDALPISVLHPEPRAPLVDLRPRAPAETLGIPPQRIDSDLLAVRGDRNRSRSEEHTSELQSRGHLVCRLLLEKKKSRTYIHSDHLTSPDT